jgi:hypothetical protein
MCTPTQPFPIDKENFEIKHRLIKPDDCCDASTNTDAHSLSSELTAKVSNVVRLAATVQLWETSCPYARKGLVPSI